MLKFLKIFIPAGAGTAGVLALAYVAADQFVVDVPAPIREAIAIAPAAAQEAPAEAAAPAAEPVVTAEVAVTHSEASVPSIAGGYGLGRQALPEEIAAWDHDVRPDGLGLPVGSGDVFTGEELFVERCAMCHGDFGEAVGRWPVLAGGYGTLTRRDPVKTIGSYWPYLSTVYDYVARAMPFGQAESLNPDELYAITAYLLYVNDIVGDDFELSNENFLEVRLENEANFYDDDRLTTEFPVFVRPDICMENCKDSVEITMHATVLDVTPEDASDNPPAATEAAAEAPAEEAAAPEAAAPEAPAEEAAAEAPAEEAAAVEAAADDTAALDPALVAAGEDVFKKCRSCHQVGEGATNRSGPQLNAIMGRTVGGVDGFRYSAVFSDAAAAGEVWTAETLGEFLANPRGARAGTKMSFAGLRSQEDIDAVLAYLQANSAE